MSSAGDGEAVANAFVVTVVSACSGGVVALVAFRVRTGYWKIVPTINGALVRGNVCPVSLRECWSRGSGISTLIDPTKGRRELSSTRKSASRAESSSTRARLGPEISRS